MYVDKGNTGLAIEEKCLRLSNSFAGRYTTGYLISISRTGRAMLLSL
jgi:hypothetical protein